MALVVDSSGDDFEMEVVRARGRKGGGAGRKCGASPRLRSGTRKCRVPVSCLLAVLCRWAENSARVVSRAPFPPLYCPWRIEGQAGWGRKGKAPTVSRKHHKGANFLDAVKGEALPCSPFARGLLLTALVIFGAAEMSLSCLFIK